MSKTYKKRSYKEYEEDERDDQTNAKLREKSLNRRKRRRIDRALKTMDIDELQRLGQEFADGDL